MNAFKQEQVNFKGKGIQDKGYDQNQVSNE